MSGPSGKPASRKVGMAGSAKMRRLPQEARMRIMPPLTCRWAVPAATPGVAESPENAAVSASGRIKQRGTKKAIDHTDGSRSAQA